VKDHKRGGNTHVISRRSAFRIDYLSVGELAMDTMKIEDLPVVEELDSAAMAEVRGGLLTARKRGENPIEYLQVTMKDVLINSIPTE